MALEMRVAIGALTERRGRLGHDIGFGIGIAHGYATLGTIGFEGRFDYAAIGTVSNLYGHFGLVRMCRLGHNVPWVKA
jgi:adenylate cyclase